MPRTAIESQALVDFINDWTELQMPEEKSDNTYYTIHFDGSRQLEGLGAGVVLASCGTLIRMEQGAFARQPRITPDARQVHNTAFQVQKYSSNTCI